MIEPIGPPACLDCRLRDKKLIAAHETEKRLRSRIDDLQRRIYRYEEQSDILKRVKDAVEHFEVVEE